MSTTALAAPAAAQVVTDGSVGPALRIESAGGVMAITEDLGRRVGPNLFHSFEDFGVPAGETAAFSGGADVRSVISRVTGGRESAIDGTVAVDAGGAAGADFYFVNPAGIRFGPDSAVIVPGGDVHIGAADSVVLGDGTVFSATQPAATLTVAEPAAFGFLGTTPGRLTLEGARLVSNDNSAASLSGREIAIGPDPATGRPGAFGVIDNGATVAVAGGGPQSPVIFGALTGREGDGRVTISGGSGVIASGSTEGSAGIAAVTAGEIALTGSSLVAADNDGTGSAGIALLSGDSVLIDEGSQLTANAATPGDFLGLAIVRGGDLTVSNGGAIAASALDFSQSDPTASDAPAGEIRITADSVTLSGGGQLLATAFGEGTGGFVEIDAGSVLATGTGGTQFVGTLSPASGIQAFGSRAVENTETGIFQAVEVSADSFRLTDGAEVIFSSPFTRLAGDFVVRGGDVLWDGGALVRGNTIDSAEAGFVIVEADSFTLRDAAVNLVSSPDEAGELDFTAGLLDVTALDIDIGGSSFINVANETQGESGTTRFTGERVRIGDTARIAVESFGEGFGGNIAITAAEIVIEDSALITASGFDAAAGGGVEIEGAERVTIAGQARIGANTVDGPGGSVRIVAPDVTIGSPGGSPEGVTTPAFVSAVTRGAGAGGAIGIGAERLVLQGNSEINATTFSSGPAGGIGLLGTESFLMTDFAQVRAGPESNPDAAPTPARFGDGGNVFIQSPAVTLAGRTLVTASAIGEAAGGNIRIEGSGSVVLADTANVLADTEDGPGGSISIAGGDLLIGDGDPATNNVFVAAASTGTGQGGSITISGSGISLFGLSAVNSEAFGPGDAGDITISGTRFVEILGFASVFAGPAAIDPEVTPSGLGDGGDIAISAPDIVLAGIDGTIQTVNTVGRFGGDGGRITLDGERITLAEVSSVDVGGLGASDGGSVDIRASEYIQLLDAADVTADVDDGVGGSVTLAAPEVFLTDDAVVQAASFGTGPGGVVDISGERIVLRGQTVVRSSAFGPGPAGDVRISASEFVNVFERGLVFAGSDLFTEFDENGEIVTIEPDGPLGDGGNIEISAPDIVLASVDEEVRTVVTAGQFGGAGGQIRLTGERIEMLDLTSVDAGGFGVSDGGGIEVTAGQRILLRGSADVIADIDDGAGGSIAFSAPEIVLADGSVVAAATFGLGDGGFVQISGERVTLSGDASIAAETAGPGDAGFVSVEAAERIAILDDARIFAGTDPTLLGEGVPLPEVAGAGGTIFVAAPEIEITGSGRVGAQPAINANTAPLAPGGSAGDAGDIVVEGDRVTLTDTTIAAEAVASGGGEIAITADEIFRMTNAAVETSVASGGGDGGNVAIRGTLIVIDADSRVAADATDGNGGNLDIDGIGTFIDADAVISAISLTGAQGTIRIAGAEENVVQIETVDPGFFDPRLLIGDPCAATASQRSSLVIAGSGGARVTGEGAAGLFLDAVPYPEGDGDLGAVPPLGPRLAAGPCARTVSRGRP